MEYNQALLDQIVKNLNVEKITAKCLLNCGLSSIEECEDFLNPSLDKLTKLETLAISEDDDAFKLMYCDPDKVSMEVFYDFNKNKDKYEIVIIFDTSC